MSLPTVGRVVHVQRGGRDPYAAIVTYVHSNTGRVNVACFTPAGGMHAMNGIYFRDSGDSPESQYAEWPEKV